MNRLQLAADLRAERARRNLTREQAGAAAQLSPSTITALERGDGTLRSLNKLMKLYKMKFKTDNGEE